MLTLLLIYSFLFGIAAGALNDVNKLIRGLLGERRGELYSRLCEKKLVLVGSLLQRPQSKALKTAMPVIIFVQDVLLFVFIGFGIVVLNFYLNRGQMRLYTVTSVAAGFLAYCFTVGKLVSLVSDVLLFLVRAVFTIALRVISLPIVFIFSLVKKAALGAVKKIIFLLEKRSAMRYNKKRSERLLRLSACGFISDIGFVGDNDGS